MKPVLRIVRLLLSAAPWAMARGAALSVVVLLMGAALLALSGWFITATGLAGLAGIGIAFDVFRPSAGVRFLALGRTAARYGERLLTHDATLRALAALRVTLLRRHTGADARALMGLRSESALTRIVSDVDALDGLILRLVLPVGAAIATHLIVFAALGWIVGWPVALVVLAGTVPVSVLILWRLALRGIVPSARIEEEGQSLRRGVIDTIRDRDALILSGALPRREEGLLDIDASVRAATAALDRAERSSGFLLSSLIAVVAAAAFLAGGSLLAAGQVDAAVAVIGLFVSLALAEAVLPLRRGFAELGRMVGAARRIEPDNVAPTRQPGTGRGEGQAVLTVVRPDFRLSLSAGEAVALTGPSGAGKTTLLMQIAGLADATDIRVKGLPPRDWDDPALRDVVTALPQRSALLAGTIWDNLALAGETDPSAMWAALEAVALADAIEARGGLEMRLGEGGAGLSGGQFRRLALARAVLRRPELLLLDEPGEGLDADTAKRVLDNVRAALPQAAILAVMHRGFDHAVFDRTVRLGRPEQIS
ncbi:amino acid ABC transporter ATP-binding/permease protein [Amorphus coralli]|uniref:amino acid ABC transporter ATP-binding/permease protein n=1 Tax=Amorphus coralli TaxID=340680 RepID=UPI0003824465|nr:ATP-binding cassette domain-containing protein [Amorphus coralli]